MTSLSADRRLGATQSRILQLILQADAPLRIDNLSRTLAISRNAAYQHVVALERDGFVEKAEIAPTKGRPGQTYQLTEKGRATFPKHYDLFAKLLIGLVKSRLGGEELARCLTELGQKLAGDFADRVEALEGNDLIVEVAQILLELGYEAETVPAQSATGLEVRAHNCVFHDLAKEHAEVCSLDLALLSELTGGPVEHVECVVRGGTCCRFRCKGRG